MSRTSELSRKSIWRKLLRASGGTADRLSDDNAEELPIGNAGESSGGTVDELPSDNAGELSCGNAGTTAIFFYPQYRISIRY
ncbi:MAG: hypothetical protein Q4P66_02195 [Actinomycetaceae bacterium]|nr:hypothetical protein [Actinomycetaceae bacterium]